MKILKKKTFQKANEDGKYNNINNKLDATITVY